MAKKTFRVTGMSCAACAARIERVAKKLPGVASAAVNLAAETLTIEAEKIDEKELAAVVKKAGYELLPEAADVSKQKKSKMRWIGIRLLISIIFGLPLLYASMGHMAKFPLPSFLEPSLAPNNYVIFLFVLVAPIVFVNFSFYTSGYKSLFSGYPNMDSLVAVSTTAALLYGIFAACRIFAGDISYINNLYIDSAGMILTLITVGKYIEERAKAKTSGAMKELLNLAPPTAIVLDSETSEEHEVTIDSVAVGDTIIIKPGQKLPVDGKLIAGSGFIDESMLTGEPLPVDKKIGDSVYAATINVNGSFQYRTTHVGNDTALARIVQLVQQAQGSKAPIARLADKAASIFVPVVMGLAVLAALLWYFLGNASPTFALTVFISVLVIACPCSLGLATPTSIMVAMEQGAKFGILIKNAEALEHACHIDTVVLDKTGTVTTGKPTVTSIIPEGLTEEVLLSLAASAEKNSDHPLALAVVDAAKKDGISLQRVSSFQSSTGMGIEALINKSIVRVGNLKWMTDNGIKISPELSLKASMASEQGKTAVYVSIADYCHGIIIIADDIKYETKDALQELDELDVHTVMFTGDNSKTAKFIAKELGISEYKADLMPEDKSREVDLLHTHGLTVAMVGDGINDAPALAAADISIAIGSGTDIAMETSDIILINSDLRDVAGAISLSRATMHNIKQNLVWAFAYNIIGIPIAMGVLHLFGGPLLNPMIAAAAMSLSSISVVSNALRLRSFSLRR